MIGAVLNTLNIRFDAEAIAFQLTHGEAKVLITDREFSGTIQRALAPMERRPLVIDIDDPLHPDPEIHVARRREGVGDMTYAAPLDDMRFVLSHLAGLPEIAALSGFEDADPELVEAILIEAGRFASEALALEAAAF